MQARIVSSCTKSIWLKQLVSDLALSQGKVYVCVALKVDVRVSCIDCITRLGAIKATNG